MGCRGCEVRSRWDDVSPQALHQRHNPPLSARRRAAIRPRRRQRPARTTLARQYPSLHSCGGAHPCYHARESTGPPQRHGAHQSAVLAADTPSGGTAPRTAAKGVPRLSIPPPSWRCLPPGTTPTTHPPPPSKTTCSSPRSSTKAPSGIDDTPTGANGGVGRSTCHRSVGEDLGLHASGSTMPRSHTATFNRSLSCTRQVG